MARARTIAGSEGGFTLVEITVAISVLLVGVLGAVTMVDGANSVTTQTKAREGATALARSVLEIARGVQYRDLTGAQVLAELEARPGLADSDAGTAGHQVESRNFVYTVTASACSMDDPKDDLGDHDEPTVTFCANSDALGVGELADDRNPDDLRRVTVTLDWSPDGVRADSLTQRGLITNPVGGVGPSVASLTPDTPNTDTITTTVTTASYDITTSTSADSVALSVNGAQLGAASGSGTAWTYSWDLGAVDTPNFVDCAYVLRAEAFDDKGRAGTASALTVTLNRRAPFAPANFAGGRNLSASGPHVDLQWSPSPECDVKEYRVYRGTDAATVTTLVCTQTAAQPTECVDESAPGATTLYYEVVAVDVDEFGADREGDRSGTLTVASEASNTAPTVPTNLAVCSGGNPGCDDIDGNAAPTGTAVLSWDASSDPHGIQFYRVYRDGNTYADRLDVLFPVPGKPLVFVDETAGTSHTYYVSAVDTLFGESTLSGSVSWP